MVVDISRGMRAAAVVGQSEDHLSSVKSQERQSRLQLQRHASISSGHHLQPESIQVRHFDGVDVTPIKPLRDKPLMTNPLNFSGKASPTTLTLYKLLGLCHVNLHVLK